MKNLCIIISNEYPPDTDNHPWNQEVQDDLRTVRETLNDYVFVEINLPVKAGRQFNRRLIQCKLDTIQKDYVICHIVLNTHGIPGKSDLSHDVVKQVVEHLSNKKIQIVQISALLCDGMRPLLAEEARDTVPMRSIDTKTKGKEASMVVLQKILSSMTTKIPQNFEIRGFDYAYLPSDAHDKVVRLLRGKDGVSLRIFIHQSTSISPEQITESINNIKHENKESVWLPSPNYIRATNILGLVLAEMKENVVDFLKGQGSLKEESRPLFNALEKYGQDQGLSTKLEANNVESIYKLWIKNNKIHSDERLQVYMDSLAPLYAQKLHVQTAPQKPSFFKNIEAPRIKIICRLYERSEATIQTDFQSENISGVLTKAIFLFRHNTLDDHTGSACDEIPELSTTSQNLTRR